MGINMAKPHRVSGVLEIYRQCTGEYRVNTESWV